MKTICVPAYKATLFRHFLVGLSSEEATLISRLRVTAFDAAVEELVREYCSADAVSRYPVF